MNKFDLGRSRSRLLPFEIRLPGSWAAHIGSKLDLIDESLGQKADLLLGSQPPTKTRVRLLSQKREGEQQALSQSRRAKPEPRKRSVSLRNTIKAALSSSRSHLWRQSEGQQRELWDQQEAKIPTKELDKFDLWKLKDTPPEELLRRCKDLPLPHCYALIFGEDQQYAEKPFQLKGYQNGLFSIQLIGPRVITKRVDRLGFRLFNQTKENLQLRVRQAAELYLKHEQQKRYIQFLEAREENFAALGSQAAKRIVQRAGETGRKQLEQVKKMYSLWVRRVHFICRASEAQAKALFRQNRIRARPFIRKVIPRLFLKKTRLQATQAARVYLEEQLKKRTGFHSVVYLLLGSTGSLCKFRLFGLREAKGLTLQEYKVEQKACFQKNIGLAISKWQGYLSTLAEQAAEEEIPQRLLRLLNFQFIRLVQDWIQSNLQDLSLYLEQADGKAAEHLVRPAIRMTQRVVVLKSPKKSKKKKAVQEQTLEFSLEPSFEEVQETFRQMQGWAENGLTRFEDLALIFRRGMRLGREWVPRLELRSAEFEHQFGEIKAVLAKFNRYQHLLKEFQFESLGKGLSEMSHLKVQQQFMGMREDYLTILRLEPTSSKLGVFQLDLVEAKATLAARARLRVLKAGDRLSLLLNDELDLLRKTYQAMIERARSQIPSEQVYVALKQFSSKGEAETERLADTYRLVSFYIQLLEQHFVPIESQLYELYFEILPFPLQLGVELVNLRNKLKQAEDLLTRRLESERIDTLVELEVLEKATAQCLKLDRLTNYGANAGTVGKATAILDGIRERLGSINEREGLLRQEKTEFAQLTKVLQSFEPVEQLWASALNYFMEKAEWQTTSIVVLSFQKIDRRVSRELKVQVGQLFRHFSTLKQGQPASVCQQFLAELERFGRNMWVLESLTCEGLVKKPNYYRQIFETAGKPPVEPKDVTLNLVVESGLTAHRATIEAIARKAETVWGLEKRVAEIGERLRSVRTNLDLERLVVAQIEDSQSIVDLCRNGLAELKCHPLFKTVLPRTVALDNRITLMQDTLEALEQCQAHWLFLQSLLSGEEAEGQLPEERLKFLNVDRIWAGQMQSFRKEEFLFDLVDSEAHRVKFQQASRIAEEVIARLLKYLDRKRQACPRLYFLSDQQLFAVVSAAQDPPRLLQSVLPCFDELVSVSADDLRITAISSANETLRLRSSVSIQSPTTRANPEVWLNEMQQQIRRTLRAQEQEAVASEQEYSMIGTQPGQTVLTVLLGRRTAQAQQAIRTNSLNQLSTVHSADLSELAQRAKQALTPSARVALNSVFLAQFYFKTVLSELVSASVVEQSQYQWVSKLRYYCLPGGTRIKISFSETAYSYEFVGPFSAVLTSATLRCCRQLLSAFNGQQFGLLSGGVGVGKAFTAKEVARAVGSRCVVYPCDKSAVFPTLNKLLKGMIGSGCWLCLDGLHQAEQSVLSTLAHFCQCLQQALRLKRKKLIYDSDEIKIDPACFLTATVALGAQLPDTLITQARQCPLIVPDWAVVAEATFFVKGLAMKRCKQLAAKLNTALRIIASVLPERASGCQVPTVLRRLDTLTGQDGYTQVRRALENSLLLGENNQTLNSILDQIFTGTAAQGDLFQHEQQLRAVAQQRRLDVSRLVADCRSIHVALSSRKCVLLVGDSLSGKSQAVRYLAESARVELTTLFPKSLAETQLFGQMLPSGSFEQGILEKSLRGKSEWVMLDADLDPGWMERVQSLHQDERMALATGEVCSISPHRRFFFEAGTIRHAAPSALANLALINFKPLSWQALLHQRLTVTSMEAFLKVLMEQVFECLPASSHSHLAVGCAELTNVMLGQQQDQVQARNLALLALVGVLSAYVPTGVRNQVSARLQKAMGEEGREEARHQLSKSSAYNMFEVCYNQDKKNWQEWSSPSYFFSTEQNLSFQQLFVPTNTTAMLTYFIIEGATRCNFAVAGSSGCSKSRALQRTMAANFNKGKVTSLWINANGNSSGAQLRGDLQSKINVRKSKGVYVPDGGRQVCVAFVDDLHLPARDQFGQSSCHEFLRAAVQAGGWYSQGELRKCLGLQLVVVMSQPLPARLRYKFIELGVQPYSDEEQFRIYRIILDWHFGRAKFSKEVTDRLDATVKVIVAMTASQGLLEGARVVRGLLRAAPGIQRGAADLGKLMGNQICRVQRDRLAVTAQFDRLLAECMAGQGFELLPGQLGFISQSCYKEANEEKIQELARENSLMPLRPLLVHAVRAARAVDSPAQGYVALGYSGTGRRSACLLGSAIAQMGKPEELSSEEHTQQWTRAMRKAGVARQVVCLLVSEGQLNNQPTALIKLLSGERLNFLSMQAQGKLSEQLQLEGALEQKHRQFVQNCLANFRLMFTLRPSAAFRDCIRNYPSFLRHATLDYYSEWPSEVLSEIAFHQLGLHSGPDKLPAMLASIHQRAIAMPHGGALTPCHMIRFAQSVASLVSSLKEQRLGKKAQLQAGCHKFQSTERNLLNCKNVLSSSLAQLSRLRDASRASEQELKRAEKECAAATDLFGSASAARDQLSKKKDSLSALYSKGVGKTLQVLGKSAESLQKISKQQLQQLKAYATPPVGVQLLAESLLLILQEQGPKVKQVWQFVKKSLLTDKLGRKLKQFKEEKIKGLSQSNLGKLALVMVRAQFGQEQLIAISKLAGQLAAWCRNIFEASKVLAECEPLRLQLLAVEKQLAAAEEVEKEHRTIMEEAQGKQDKCSQLTRQLAEDQLKQQASCEELERRVAKCEMALTGLRPEVAEWRRKLQALERSNEVLLWECVQLGASLAYKGCLKEDKRTQFEQQVARILQQANVWVSDCGLQQLISEPQLFWWRYSCGLGSEVRSVENAVIAQQFGSRSLFVLDSDCVAACFFKAAIKDLIVTQTADQKFKTKVQQGVWSGKPVLVTGITQIPHALIKLLNTKASSAKPGFRLYICAENQTQLQEEVVKECSIIDWRMGAKGLQEQAIALLVRKEEATREDTRLKHLRQDNDYSVSQAKVHEQVLTLLLGSTAELIQSDEMVRLLGLCREQADSRQERIQRRAYEEETRLAYTNVYAEVARKVSTLYSVLEEMSQRQPAYVPGTEPLLSLLQSVLQQTGGPKQSRVNALRARLEQLLLVHASRGIYSKDRLSLALRLYLESSDPELRRIIYSKQQAGQVPPRLRGVAESAIALLRQGKRLPNFSSDEQLAIAKVFCPDMFSSLAKQVLLEEKKLPAAEFILADIFKTLNYKTPLVLLLSKGWDPRDRLVKYAEGLGVGGQLIFFSLGAGQELSAEKLLLRSLEDGAWLVLQNCHLSPGFWRVIESAVRRIDSKTHSSFRLLITTLPCDDIPKNLLKRSIRAVFEPSSPRQNLTATVGRLQKVYDGCSPQCRQLLFAVSLLHCCCLQRNWFRGPGWTQPCYVSSYDFDQAAQLVRTLQKDYSALRGEIKDLYHGSRLTCQQDRTLLQELLRYALGPHALLPSAMLFKVRVPEEGFQTAIKVATEFQVDEAGLALLDSTSIAARTQLQSQLLLTSLDTQPDRIAISFYYCLAGLELAALQRFASTQHQSPISNFIRVECLSFIVLMKVLKEETQPVDKVALRLRQLSNIHSEQPQRWVNSVKLRYSFLCDLVQKGVPRPLPLSQLHSPHSLFETLLLVHARQYQLPPESLFVTFLPCQEDEARDPEAYSISGLSLRGASWDFSKRQLAPYNGDSTMPALRVYIRGSTKMEGDYLCPVFRQGQSSPLFYVPLDAGEKPARQWLLAGTALLIESP